MSVGAIALDCNGWHLNIIIWEGRVLAPKILEKGLAWGGAGEYGSGRSAKERA